MGRMLMTIITESVSTPGIGLNRCKPALTNSVKFRACSVHPCVHGVLRDFQHHITVFYGVVLRYARRCSTPQDDMHGAVMLRFCDIHGGPCKTEIMVVRYGVAVHTPGISVKLRKQVRFGRVTEL